MPEKGRHLADHRQLIVDYSVVIPAYNEQELLPGTLTALQKAMQLIDMQGEIIVVDNNSTDHTADIAGTFGVNLFFEPVNQISRARNTGAANAGGKFLIFLDADTTVTAELLRTALEELDSGRICGGGVTVSMDNSLTPVMRFALDLWNRISRKYQLAAGCFIYCLREGYNAIGGFSENVYASEEIWFSRKLRLWGEQRGLDFLIITTMSVITSPRKLDWYSSWQMLAFTLPILIFPPLLRFRRFCSHWYRRPA